MPDIRSTGLEKTIGEERQWSFRYPMTSRESLKGRLESAAMQLKRQGPVSYVRSLKHALMGEKPIEGFERFAPLFEGKKGLEIGGPSGVFSEKSILPVYGFAGTIDNCNFSTTTVWEGAVNEGKTFKFSKKSVCQQYVCEGA